LPIVSYPKFVRRYLQAKLAREKRVTFFAFFLDRNSRLIQAAELFRGNMKGVALYPREVLRAAYDCDAEAVFCARTDPVGDARPTSDDIASAQRLFRAFHMAEIEFHDYFVVGKVMVSLAARRCFRQHVLLQKCS
jgi:DNA repair protein RadC